MSLDREWLGVGWKFPPTVDRRGGTAVSRYEQDIAESIIVILRTAKGERVMRPDFGCDVHELVYAPNDAATAGLAIRYVTEALNQWEPRIELVTVDVDNITGRDLGRLEIGISYRIRMTNDERNLVFPFYLQTEEA